MSLYTHEQWVEDKTYVGNLMSKKRYRKAHEYLYRLFITLGPNNEQYMDVVKQINGMLFILDFLRKETS